MKSSIHWLIVFVCIVLMPSANAQHYYIPLNREIMLRYEPSLYNLQSDAHTSFRPFMNKEIERNAPFDSLNNEHVRDNKFNQSWLGRKLWKEHLFEIKGEDFAINLDPAFELTAIRDKHRDWIFINSRGLWLSGTIGERFSFSSSFYESLARLPSHVDSFVQKTRVVPGGARVKKLGSQFDYNVAYGTISYSLKKYFNFQFGNDKVFIGDGYRSLLFSDNSFPFPYFKITTNIWKVQYVNLYGVFQDMLVPHPKGYPIDDFSFRKKYGSFHYLDINIGKRASIGVMEAIIWKSDSVRAQSIDINYINPIIFLRPQEYSLGSADNALMGLNFKIKATGSITFYAQLLLDEFKLDEVKAGNGWWGNKQGFQTGVKYFNILGIKNLHLTSEYNYVRPYTYQHRGSLTAYGHYNQPFAHPLGANFWEAVSILNYKYKRFAIRCELMYAQIGYDLTDSLGNLVNYGNNVFLSYIDRVKEYGNETGQGLKSKLLYNEITVSYLVNPKYNFVIQAGAVSRIEKNDFYTNNSSYFYLGIKTLLTNRYFDF